MTEQDPEDFLARFPTMENYTAHHQRAGHICCNCPAQSPPLPCCNAGHEEAMGTARQFEHIVEEADRG